MTPVGPSRRSPAALVAVVVCAALGPATDPVAADVIHWDNLVVMDAICVGFSCSTSEDFGLDVLRLNENVVRLHFYDSSQTAGYPTSDWRIEVNDPGINGADYFAIAEASAGTVPFRIDSGAPDGMLRFGASGDLGLGTAAPAMNLHVADGNSPTLRLEQDGRAGYTPQTWDVVGNEHNFMIRDVTDGQALPFRIQPGAGDDAFFIDAAGRIGAGTAAPDARFHVTTGLDLDNTEAHLKIENTNATPRVRRMLEFSNNGGVFFLLNNTDSATRWAMVNANSGTSFLINDPDSPGREFELDQDGNVWIEGDFISDGTTLTVPDYVFEDGYALRPLAEVRAFIDDHGHLPDVPSADAIAADGLNHAEMQMLLLKKVEELTLYVLAQQDRIATLEKELAHERR